MPTTTDPLDELFAALADPTRRDIVRRLASGPRTVGELAGHYAVSRPAVSQHLAVLERAGLITRTRSAQWRECTLRHEALEEAGRWIAQQQAEWEQRLDRLEERIQARRKENP